MIAIYKINIMFYINSNQSNIVSLQDDIEEARRLRLNNQQEWQDSPPLLSATKRKLQKNYAW